MHVHCCCERSIHSNQWTARVCRRGNQQRVPGQRLRERHQMAEKRVCRVYGERSSVKGALGAPAPNPNLNPNPNTNPDNKEPRHQQEPRLLPLSITAWQASVLRPP